MSRRLAAAVLALLVVATLLAPAGVAAQEASPTPTPGNATATPGSTTPTPGPDGPAMRDRPSTAETVRVLPVSFDREFVSVTAAERGEVYNTTGPWVQFQLSAPVEQVSIPEPGARAEVLDGGHVVKVSYAEDAAPVGSQSLFHLRLFFADGSAREVDLYASKTGVDVGSTQMGEYRELVTEILNDAEDAGYERDVEGALSHYHDVREQAQLLESLLTEQAIRLALSLWSVLINPLGIAMILVAIAVGTGYLIRRRAWIYEVLSNDPGKAQRLVERAWIEYVRQQQAANEEPLEEVRGIDGSRAQYWKDAYGVETTAGLAELFRRGIPIERDGETVHVGGVDELDADTITDSSSWLNHVCRANRIPAPQLALADGKLALKRMITKWGMGHHYSGALDRTQELIDDLDESRSFSGLSSSGPSQGVGGAAAGGDD